MPEEITDVLLAFLHIRRFCTSGASAHQEFLHLSRLACVYKLDVRQARPDGLAKPSLSASRFSLATYLSSDSRALPLFLPAAAAAVVVPASASSSTAQPQRIRTCASWHSAHVSGDDAPGAAEHVPAGHDSHVVDEDASPDACRGCADASDGHQGLERRKEKLPSLPRSLLKDSYANLPWTRRGSPWQWQQQAARRSRQPAAAGSPPSVGPVRRQHLCPCAPNVGENAGEVVADSCDSDIDVTGPVR